KTSDISVDNRKHRHIHSGKQRKFGKAGRTIMNFRILALAASTAMSPLCLAVPAFADDGALAQGPTAQAPSDASAEASGDIVVRARTRAETAQSAPLAITAVGQETLENHAITNIGQASQLTPGLVAAPSLFVDVLFIRGVGTPGTTLGAEQSVGLFIDGVPYG